MKQEEILELLKNKDSKHHILTTLTQSNDSKVIYEIIKLFDDDDVEIRGEVFSSLFLNQNNILKELIMGLDNKSKNIRAYVTLVLANRKEKDAIKDIQKLTKDSSGLVRTCAYGALGHLKVKEARKEMHDGIFDSNVEAVKSAAYALSQIGEKISQKEMEELQKLDDPGVKKILKKF